MTLPKLAQATQVPQNGASNAEDFQPPTQNPQTAPASLQPGGGAQSTGDQSILNTENARIVVPGGSPNTAPQPPPATPKDGFGLIGWTLIVLLAGAACYVLVLLARKRRPAPLPSPIPEPAPLKEPAPVQVAPSPEPKPKPPSAQKRPRPKKSKSKSKRKKR